MGLPSMRHSARMIAQKHAQLCVIWGRIRHQYQSHTRSAVVKQDILSYSLQHYVNLLHAVACAAACLSIGL